jgi:hypothetical protein
MPFFQINHPRPALKNSGPRFVAAMALLITSVLMGCGGGGSSTSDSGSGAGSEVPASQVYSGVYTTSFIYASGINKNKAVTLIINRDSLNSINGRFYAWQFSSPEAQGEQPNIFSGTITGIGDSSASISDLSEFSIYENTSKAGRATFTSPTQGILKGDVIQGVNTTEWSNANGITLETNDSSNSLVDTWTGNLYYPTGGLNTNLSITFTRSPTNSEPNNLIFDLQFGPVTNTGPACKINTTGIATPSTSGVNLYNLSMVLTNSTLCVLRDKLIDPESLTGVAYVTTSPVPGKTKRLQWVAITSQGRGLSFRADR